MIKIIFSKHFLITLMALILTFLFFIFSQYYKPIFAIRIFCVDAAGLLVISIFFSLLRPNYQSIVKRSLAIVFIYFTLYEFADNLIFFAKHHFFSRRSRTDFVEAETAVITFLITFLVAGMVKLSQPSKVTDAE